MTGSSLPLEVNTRQVFKELLMLTNKGISFMALACVSLLLSGCLGFSANMRMNKQCPGFKRYDPSIEYRKCSNILDIEAFVISNEIDRYCVTTHIDCTVKPQPTPADIPDEVIIYALKEFAGLTGGEYGFNEFVKASSTGLRGLGNASLLVKYDSGMSWINLSHIAEHKHLSVIVWKDSMSSRTYAVDLSDVDVSIKPEAPERSIQKGGGKEAELIEANQLRDKGLITEDEYRRMRESIIGR